MSDKKKGVHPIMHSDVLPLLGLLLIPLIGILGAMALPAANFVSHQHLVGAFGAMLVVAGVGVALLFWARLPLYRQRKFFSFGSRALPPSSVPIYRAAYALLIPSVLFLLLLVLVTR